MGGNLLDIQTNLKRDGKFKCEFQQELDKQKACIKGQLVKKIKESITLFKLWKPLGIKKFNLYIFGFTPCNYYN